MSRPGGRETSLEGIEVPEWNDNSLNYCPGNGKEEKPGEIFRWKYLRPVLDDTLSKERKSQR